MPLACRCFTRRWVLFCPWNRGKIAYFEACPVATPEMAAFSTLLAHVFIYFIFFLPALVRPRLSAERDRSQQNQPGKQLGCDCGAKEASCDLSPIARARYKNAGEMGDLSINAGPPHRCSTRFNYIRPITDQNPPTWPLNYAPAQRKFRQKST